MLSETFYVKLVTLQEQAEEVNQYLGIIWILAISRQAF